VGFGDRWQETPSCEDGRISVSAGANDNEE
jgi:hypothetical protein